MSSKTIELDSESMLTEERKKRFSVGFFVLKFLVFAAVVGAGSFIVSDYLRIAGQKIQTKYEQIVVNLREKFNLIEYRTQVVPANQAKMKDLVDSYSKKYHVNPAVTWAMIDVESGGDTTRIRFENGWKRDYSNRFPKPSGINEIEYDLNFSSIGLLQVSFCIHKERCGLNSFADLLNPGANLDCGLSYLSNCLQDRKEVKERGKRLWMCIRDYNGKGPDAERHADRVMSRLADHLITESDVLKDG